MTYFITGEWSSDGQRTPVSLDQATDAQEALAMARQVYAEGAVAVTIEDGGGNSISGPDLIACCNEEMHLTSDLRAVPK